MGIVLFSMIFCKTPFSTRKCGMNKVKNELEKNKGILLLESCLTEKKNSLS